jgi:hypothetical protein
MNQSKDILRFVHIDADQPDFPDTGEVCCMGVAAFGPGRCTCWEPVYDGEQCTPIVGTPQVNVNACFDCAFRQGSPERRGADGYEHNSNECLDDMCASKQGVFYCHQGMRRILSYVHPSGMTIAAHPAEYRPVIIDHVAYKRDGTLAGICAGFEARRGDGA